jgi:hypothetical protein
VVERLDEALSLTIYDGNGTVLSDTDAEERIIEDGARISRVGFKSSEADLRVRVRDDASPATVGMANLTFDAGNKLLHCDVVPPVPGN